MSKIPAEIIEDIRKLSNNLETAAKVVTEMAWNFERSHGVGKIKFIYYDI
jgi:hypothetical protein